MAKAKVKEAKIEENGIAAPVNNDVSNVLSDVENGIAEGTNPVDGPRELTAEEHEAAAIKAAVEASGIYHLNTFFNQMLKTAQKADDAIKNDPRTTNWTLPEIEKLFFSLRGK